MNLDPTRRGSLGSDGAMNIRVWPDTIVKLRQLAALTERGMAETVDDLIHRELEAVLGVWTASEGKRMTGEEADSERRV